VKRIVVGEYGRIIPRNRKGETPDGSEQQVFLEAGLYNRLYKMDQKQQKNGKQVFVWYADHAQAQQWVGVIQIPGLQVEILPKIDVRNHEDERGTNSEPIYDARKNLLYMLAIAGDVPIRSRDVARLTSRRAPLSETLAAIFADRLLRELLRGLERNYLLREENLRTYKGKLLLSRHIAKNAGHRERFYCSFDEFSDDTFMNRVFKAACKVLLGATRTPHTEDTLRHCLLVLEHVQDITSTSYLFDRVVINRQNERFRDVFNFCRLILSGKSPTAQAGQESSFTLLFDMNQVFERFIAAFLKKRVLVNMQNYQLYPQARTQRRHLMHSVRGGVLPLKPDLLLRNPSGCHLVIDTKWKRLTGAKGGRGGISNADLYQLYAYTQRYGCQQSMLLYPKVSGISEQDFHALDENGKASGQRVGVRFVQINRNLHSESERRELANELHDLVLEGFEGKCDEITNVTT
jgi:5-methylcytosine-specific restriction enzyme subunit McrC